MASNILIAIKNLIESPIIEIKSYYAGRNRANNVGGALEEYIKDLFANTLNIDDEYLKNQQYSEVFSYMGNQNNPPDMILSGGDSIEVKKIQGNGSSLALNSSYPKAKLHSNSSMLTGACKNCEIWDIKDIIYVVGNTDDTSIKSLWFVYGDCYAADKEIYKKIKNKISQGLVEIPNIELVKTNELGGIKKVDPLGITNLRIRGMWHISHPQKVYNYIPKREAVSKFKFYCIMKKEKFETFSQSDKTALIELSGSNSKFNISEVQIKDPNNPANLINTIFMEFYHG
jgi:hypothetical protein